TRTVDAELLDAVAASTRSRNVAGIYFPDCAHVLDPLELCLALVRAAAQRGTVFEQADVRSLNLCGDEFELTLADQPAVRVLSVVVCAGPWSAPLLTPFSLPVPLECARGYHVELPEHVALVDAPV